MHRFIPLFLSLCFTLAASLVYLDKQAQAQPQYQPYTPAPNITASTWLNSPPLSLKDLRGKVVLVKFWTFGCYNCNNVEPYVKAWYDQYKDKGFVVIAVHSPEFDYERNIRNVQNYIQKEGVTYPIAIDNDFITWRAYKNRAWPTMYLIDKKGVIRHQRIGEGGYNTMETMIQKLLNEASE